MDNIIIIGRDRVGYKLGKKGTNELVLVDRRTCSCEMWIEVRTDVLLFWELVESKPLDKHGNVLLKEIQAHIISMFK